MSVAAACNGRMSCFRLLPAPGITTPWPRATAGSLDTVSAGYRQSWSAPCVEYSWRHTHAPPSVSIVAFSGIALLLGTTRSLATACWRRLRYPDRQPTGCRARLWSFIAADAWPRPNWRAGHLTTLPPVPLLRGWRCPSAGTDVACLTRYSHAGQQSGMPGQFFVACRDPEHHSLCGRIVHLLRGGPGVLGSNQPVSGGVGLQHYW
jgi:hypothetical protein